MCARAMANMGIDRLILVSPQGELNEDAKQGAAHAQKILRESVVYASLKDFHAREGEGLRIALSGRGGRLTDPSPLGDVLREFAHDPSHRFHDSRVPIYLMFGPEDDGLSNEEMALCHHICHLPTYGEITSLNLSHAVLLAAYMVQTATRSLTKSPPESPQETSASTTPLYYPAETIRRWLEALGFDLSARRISIEKTLNRILLSRCPTPEELRIIDTVLQQTVRKLKGD